MHLELDVHVQINELFDDELCGINHSMRYLSFLIKPNDYLINDQDWLISRVERKLNQWCNQCLSRVGLYILIKSIIEGLPIYWTAITHIPRNIMDHIHKMSFGFMWRQDKDAKSFHQVPWDKISLPNNLGGWEIKHHLHFYTTLAAKGIWRLITTIGLWTIVIHQKYISPLTIHDWIRSEHRKTKHSSITWKYMYPTYHIILDWICYNIGNGKTFRISIDTQIGRETLRLPKYMIQHLINKCFNFLYQIMDFDRSTILSQVWFDATHIGLTGDVIDTWEKYI